MSKAMTRCCGNCRWIEPILKASEIEYYGCGYRPLSRPLIDILFNERGEKNYLLNVGDPASDYAELCVCYKEVP
jgi:hypothetical protein